MAIITILLSIFTTLFNSGICPKPTPSAADPNPVPPTPQETVAAHYDESTGTYDTYYVKSLRMHSRQAAREAGTPRLSKQDLDANTIAALDKVRTATDSQVTAFVANPTVIPSE